MAIDLYDASVPVFRHYLDRAEGLVGKASADPNVLAERLVPDMFTAAEQFATAAGFALRIAYPLAGRETPEFEDVGMEIEGLTKRIAFARDGLDAQVPGAVSGAARCGCAGPPVGGDGGFGLAIPFENYADMAPLEESFAEFMGKHMKKKKLDAMFGDFRNGIESTHYTIYKHEKDMSMSMQKE